MQDFRKFGFGGLLWNKECPDNVVVTPLQTEMNKRV